MKLRDAQPRAVGIGGLALQTIVSRVLTQFEAMRWKVGPFAAMRRRR